MFEILRASSRLSRRAYRTVLVVRANLGVARLVLGHRWYGISFIHPSWNYVLGLDALVWAAICLGHDQIRAGYFRPILRSGNRNACLAVYNGHSGGRHYHSGSPSNQRCRPGSWELTVDLGRDALGQRQRRFLTVRGTKAQAQRKLRELLSTLDKGLALPGGKILLRDWLDRWLAERIGLTPTGARAPRNATGTLPRSTSSPTSATWN